MFKVMTDERWFDHEDGLPEGVRVLMGPIDDDAEDIASDVFKDLAQYDGEVVVFEHDDTKRAIKAHDIALMAACVRDWEGVGNAAGTEKLALNIETARKFISQRQIYGVLWAAFLQPYHYRLLEKNVSSPLPNSTGAAAGGETENNPDPLPDVPSGLSSGIAGDSSASAD